MGAGSSTEEVRGVRVFKVLPGSPAAEAGLEVFFDFILTVNGVRLESQKTFSDAIKLCENGAAKLKVYSCRSHTTREVFVTPRQWGGKGLLGATVSYDSADPADCHGIRVMEVFEGSPAQQAGLAPFTDHMLGMSGVAFREIDDLAAALKQSLNEPLKIAVYNSQSESVREVTVLANNNWGGAGCIGCGMGTGLLHCIPAPRVNLPRGTLLVPAPQSEDPEVSDDLSSKLPFSPVGPAFTDTVSGRSPRAQNVPAVQPTENLPARVAARVEVQVSQQGTSADQALVEQVPRLPKDAPHTPIYTPQDTAELLSRIQKLPGSGGDMAPKPHLVPRSSVQP